MTVVDTLKAEKAKLLKQVAVLDAAIEGLGGGAAAVKKGRPLTEAAKKKLSVKAKARWAAKKAAAA